MDKIIVKAPGHLHVGNFDLSGDLGRLYGTVGVALDRPNMEVEVRKSDGISTDDESAYEFAQRFVKKYGLEGAEINIKHSIPKYVGIGYHTTLALSISEGLSELYGLNMEMEEIALSMKRGLITALGTYACKVGGFIVEGGFKIDEIEEMVPPLIFRQDIPEDWIFVVAIPERPRRKIAEMRKEKEEEILKGMRKMSGDLSAELTRIILIKILPSLIERDIGTFGKSLTDFNSKVGTVWSEYQGGIYCDEIVRRGIELMKEMTYCACQSSWGPTFYGIVEGESKAKGVVRELDDFLGREGGGEVFYTKARNEGLEVV